MKILLVTQYFWPEVFRVNDLVRGWQERGHEVTVLTGIPNYPEGRPYEGYSLLGPVREEFGASRVHRVPLVPRGSGRPWRLAANYLSFALTASALGPFRCQGPFDCVFVYQLSPVTVGIPGAWLRRHFKAPMILWVQDLWPESLSAVGRVRSTFIIRQVGRIVEWIYRRCDLVLVQSSDFLAAVESRGVPAERRRYLPNWCEDFYQPVPRRPEERDQLPLGFVFLFAGNLGDAQALDTILDAAQQTTHRRDIHWVLMGEGSRRKWLQAEIEHRDLSGTVHWFSPRPVTEMPRWFAAADALLITLNQNPVLARTIPTKLQSYLACARPILAALDGEGASQVLAAQAGQVGPAEDGARLARNALELADRPTRELDRLGRQGRDYYLAEFGREHLLDRLDAWLADLPVQRTRQTS